MDFCYKEWWRTLNRCWNRSNEFNTICEAVSVPHHEQIIADIGCDSLLYAKYIYEKDFDITKFKYVGIDKREYSLEDGIRDVLSYRIEDVNDNSLRSNHYNVIICTWLLDVVNKPLYVLEEMKRISTHDSDVIIELPSTVGAHIDIQEIINVFKNISIEKYTDRLSRLHRLVKEEMNINRVVNIDACINIANKNILSTILNGYLNEIADERIRTGLVEKAAMNTEIDCINNRSKIYIC